MNGKIILTRFGFKVDYEPKSIYPYSPVYKVNYDDKQLIVKRTQRPMRRAENLIQFTTFLKLKGIPIVTPVHLNKPNPQMIGSHVYIVYPFIEGSQYIGSDNQIYESGCLLGKIHALSSSDNHFKLPTYDVFDFTLSEIDTVVEKINDLAKKQNFALNSKRLKEILSQAVFYQEKLKDSSIPYVSTPYDYKANNLIFTPQPFIIDPDHASWVPRIFDLALALLLFHNEMPTAPSRMFSKEEWKIFLAGYQEYVDFTQEEKELWPNAIYHLFLDEVMWLMVENPDDWKNPQQRSLFFSILKFIGAI